ncbi:(Fe-S)-binding protein [Chloroflexota bacterium]
MGLKRVSERIWTCSSSGQCIGKGPTNPFGGPSSPLGMCPPAEYFRQEGYTPRGRLYLARLLYNNTISPTAEELDKIAYTCEGCGWCDEVCTLRPMEAFIALREEMVDRGDAPPEANKKVDENVRSKHNFMGARPEARAKWAEGLNLPKTGEILYYAGCYASYRHPETAKATVKLLKSAGIDVAYLGNDEWCCGIPPLWNGERAIAIEMMKHNFQEMVKSGTKKVVTSCAECYRTLKINYPEEVGELPFEVLHISEFLADLISQGKLQFKKLDEKVTYHDPCFLGRHAKVYDEPRKVIESIPGVKLVEMERCGEWSVCCGSGAGVVKTAYPELTEAQALKRITEVKATANTVVTACPRCVETLKTAVKDTGLKIAVFDLPVFAAKALG